MRWLMWDEGFYHDVWLIVDAGLPVVRARSASGRIKERRRAISRGGALLTLFAAASVGALAQNLSEQSPAYRALHPPTSFDTRPVSVPFGSTVYIVPRNYLVGLTQPRVTDAYASFAIYVLLPDLSPRTPANSGELDRTGWHDQLRALFEYKVVPRPKEQTLRFYLGISKKSEDDYRLIGNRYKFYELPNNAPHEIYTTDTPNGLFMFSCDRENDFKVVISPSCTVIESLGNGVGAIYHFGREHLLEAVDIDTKLRALLKSFAAK